VNPSASLSADLPAVLDGASDEVQRQDGLHPAGYPATRDGIRLGLAAAQDELDEALGAWHQERCRCGTPPGCQHSRWAKTREELLQLAAVALRAVRSIDSNNLKPTTRTDEAR